MNGYWTTFGEAASVDWCEPNYVVTRYIAELGNTLSSVVMVLLGLYALRWVWRQRAWIEPRFVLCYLSLVVVGLGSVAFHGTLLETAQAADELPMIYGGLALFYCLVNRKHGDPSRERRWAIGLTMYAVAFTVGYFSFPDHFGWFIASYAAIVAMLVIGGVWICLGPEGSPTHRRLVGAAAGAYVGAVFIFWMPEHVLLACDHPLQSLHLHSAWHVLAGLGTYLGFLFAVWDRQVSGGRQAAVRMELPLPWVEVSAS